MFSQQNEDIPKYKLTESLVCAENLGRKVTVLKNYWNDHCFNSFTVISLKDVVYSGFEFSNSGLL